MNQVENEVLWRQCQTELRFVLEEKEYYQWIEQLKAETDGSELVLLAVNPMWAKHLRNNYLEKITEVVQKISQGIIQSVRVDVMVNTTPTKSDSQATSNKTSKKKNSVEGLPIDPAFTFDTFVKGKSNSMAYNACNELSKRDSNHNYGPIFIYGSSGLGKTHLMQAVAHRYHRYEKSFCYFTKDHFYSQIVKAFNAKKIDQLIKNICQHDLLIVDDVHMFGVKTGPKVYDVLMNLVDDFSTHGKQKQLILASDKPPSQLDSFGDRGISRLSAFLQLAIEPPDMDMRVQILEKKAAVLDLDLPKDCAFYMAQNLPPDVRGLEGALKNVQLAAASLMGNEPISIELVKRAIKGQIQVRIQALNAENIRDLVAKYYDVSPKDLIGKKRSRQIARPRQMAMALIRELTRDSFPEIGQVFGGRDHTTVMHACEKIHELREIDTSIEKDYHSLKMMLEYV